MADHPGIHPNYLATKTDCDMLVEGIRIARKIARQLPLADVISQKHSPGGRIDDDDYDGLLNWARNTSTTIYHPTGKCKMGSDKMAVVAACCWRGFVTAFISNCASTLLKRPRLH